MYQICMFTGKHDKDSLWHPYTKGNDQRYRWQMDFAQTLVKHGVEHASETDGFGEVEYPPWHKQGHGNSAWTPCDCKTCHLCTTGVLNGVAHFVRPPMLHLQIFPNRVLTQASPKGATSAYESRRLSVEQSQAANVASHAERASAGNGDRCQACLIGLKAANQARLGAQKWTTEEIKQRRNWTRQKCAGCNLRICDACWGSSGELWDHEAKCSSRSDFASWPKKASI